MAQRLLSHMVMMSSHILIDTDTEEQCEVANSTYTHTQDLDSHRALPKQIKWSANGNLSEITCCKHTLHLANETQQICSLIRFDTQLSFFLNFRTTKGFIASSDACVVKYETNQGPRWFWRLRKMCKVRHSAGLYRGQQHSLVWYVLQYLQAQCLLYPQPTIPCCGAAVPGSATQGKGICHFVQKPISALLQSALVTLSQRHLHSAAQSQWGHPAAEMAQV